MVLKNTESKSIHINVSGYYGIISFLFLIIFDKISKIWALTLNKEIDYGIFAISLTTNTGAGFSILKDSNTLLIWIAIIALGAAIYFREHFPKTGFVLICAGIFSNLLDRIMYGYVIDFINLKFWPIFNAADAFIFIGVIITAVYWWKKDKKTHKKRKKAKKIGYATRKKRIVHAKGSVKTVRKGRQRKKASKAGKSSGRKPSR